MGKQRGSRGSKNNKTQTNTHVRTIWTSVERVSALDNKKDAERKTLEVEGSSGSDNSKQEHESCVGVDHRYLQ